MELIKDVIIPLHDTCLILAKLAATNPQGAGVLQALNEAMLNLKKADKALREKLLVMMMAKEEGWEAAVKLERRLRGVYENEHVAKVLEDKEKQKSKEKRDREKEKKSAGI